MTWSGGGPDRAFCRCDRDFVCGCSRFRCGLPSPVFGLDPSSCGRSPDHDSFGREMGGAELLSRRVGRKKQQILIWEA